MRNRLPEDPVKSYRNFVESHQFRDECKAVFGDIDGDPVAGWAFDEAMRGLETVLHGLAAYGPAVPESEGLYGWPIRPIRGSRKTYRVIYTFNDSFVLLVGLQPAFSGVFGDSPEDEAT